MAAGLTGCERNYQVVKKFQITAGILAVISIVLIGVFSLILNSMAGKLDSQRVCERWASDDMRYAQISAFISPYAGFDDSFADRSLTSSLDNALTTASITPANEDASLYTYAYSSETNVSLSYQSPETGQTVKSGVNAATLGVGGDFFIFHPLKLLSGQYFDATDTILNDLIIIDENIAWQFFGSYDVAGFELMVNGQRCFISGVCEVDENYSKFYGDGGRVFMSYSLLKKMNGDELPITCYELCLPNPVSGFALDILNKNLGVDESQVELVENSDRFTNSALLHRLTTFSERSVRQKLVAYPYWENTAVMLTDRAALLFIFKLVPAIVLVLLLAAEIVIAYVNRAKIFRFVADSFKNIYREYKYKRDSRPPKPPKAPKPKKQKRVSKKGAKSQVAADTVSMLNESPVTTGADSTKSTSPAKNDSDSESNSPSGSAAPVSDKAHDAAPLI